MKVLLNYANWRFRELQEGNSASGLAVGGFDSVLAFGPEDIEPAFAARCQHILRQERGNGYWLWKPYFISRTLATLAEGDVLFYCDSGAHFVASIDPLIDLCHRTEQDVIVFELPFPERQWTKRDAFVLLGCDSPKFTDTPQRLASFSLWKNSPQSQLLARQWLELAQDERVLTDLPNQCGLSDYPDFREHRHDQSLFSLLTKKHGLGAFRNPSQRGHKGLKRYPLCTYGVLIEHTRRIKAPPAVRLWRSLKRAAGNVTSWLPGRNASIESRRRAA
jgi:hypothetical protein